VFRLWITGIKHPPTAVGTLFCERGWGEKPTLQKIQGRSTLRPYDIFVYHRYEYSTSINTPCTTKRMSRLISFMQVDNVIILESALST